MTQDSEIDQIDHHILQTLSKDGRISITELSAKVGLSKTPCQLRVKRLQARGYILGFRAVLSPEKLNKNHVAFVEVKLTDTREAALKAFNDAVQSHPEIEQCHMIAGAFDYLLKVRTQNITDYRRALGETISNLPNVASTSTHVVMESVKEQLF